MKNDRIESASTIERTDVDVANLAQGAVGRLARRDLLWQVLRAERDPHVVVRRECTRNGAKEEKAS